MMHPLPPSTQRASLPCLALFGLLAAALPVGCAPKPEPPAPVVQAPEPAPAPPVVEAPPPALPPVQLAWSFDPPGEACQARANGGAASLGLVVRKGQPSLLTLSGARRRPLRPGAVAIAFRGAAGAWQGRGRASRQAVALLVQPNERGLGEVLALLGGGTVEVGGNRAGLPPFQLPPAGDPGRAWFDCAKGKLLG